MLSSVPLGSVRRHDPQNAHRFLTATFLALAAFFLPWLQLLTRNPSKRLGSSVDDAQEVQRHPFFAALDWDRIMRREVPSSSEGVGGLVPFGALFLPDELPGLGARDE